MYKQLTPSDIRRVLNVSDDYRVDGLLVSGTHPPRKEYPHFEEALRLLGVPYTEETIEDRFFQEVKSVVIGQKRIWFDVVYGAAYLSELTHVASILGSKANILLGSCGALQENLMHGDTVIPSASFGDESVTRMYQRDNKDFIYRADDILSRKIRENFLDRSAMHDGTLMTVQAMLGETEGDVKEWSRQGYIGIDMESATLFAVSAHFSVPAAALLYVADNLAKNELVTDAGFALLREQRRTIRKENYIAALKILAEVS